MKNPFTQTLSIKKNHCKTVRDILNALNVPFRESRSTHPREEARSGLQEFTVSGAWVDSAILWQDKEKGGLTTKR